MSQDDMFELKNLFGDDYKNILEDMFGQDWEAILEDFNEEPLGNNAEPIRKISEDDWRKDDR